MIKEIKINDIYDNHKYQHHGGLGSNNLVIVPKSKNIGRDKSNPKMKPISTKLKIDRNYSKEELYMMAKAIKQKLGGGNIKLSNLKKEQLLEFVKKYQLG
tara:strand:+ start:3005 stop:3304 length:300 start_codon:yes stop_codon:yes gene_type:complete